MKFLIKQFCLTSCQVISPWSKCSQQPVLKYRQLCSSLYVKDQV
jgi:hypothetical protein